jgi:hypothetical protein
MPFRFATPQSTLWREFVPGGAACWYVIPSPIQQRSLQRGTHLRNRRNHHTDPRSPRQHGPQSQLLPWGTLRYTPLSQRTFPCQRLPSFEAPFPSQRPASAARSFRKTLGIQGCGGYPNFDQNDLAVARGNRWMTESSSLDGSRKSHYERSSEPSCRDRRLGPLPTSRHSA